MIVKVCGLSDGENIKEVIKAGANWIGMIFWPQSPRFVSMIRSYAGILPDRGSLNAAAQSKDMRRVGVFVDEMAQNIITRVVNYNLDFIQLHGNEGMTLIDNLRNTLVPSIRKELGIIKTISISAPEDFRRCDDYEEGIDYFLFDTKCAEKGGSGRKFEWQWLNEYRGRRPFLISGGIGPDDVEAVKAITHPLCYGVDINSKFETSPGIKDAEAVRQFIQTINNR